MLHRQLGFSSQLSLKIEALSQANRPVKLGSMQFSSPLLLAPMSGISTPPFRLFMQALGAGGSVSELVSCHGINHGNLRTRQMLKVDEREKHMGLQLFGEDAQSMAEAAKVAQDNAPGFIDINMGCPVKKVVSKGSGSALLKETAKLGGFFAAIKKATILPVTIKIRTGWDQDTRNAPEVIRIAREEGIEFVAIHGRTRAQQYQGNADWDYLEWVAGESSLPIIGNGDLNRPDQIRRRLKETRCHAMMMGRGPLRDPFLFLKVNDASNQVHFTPQDYGEAVIVLSQLLVEHAHHPREALTNIKKHTVWMSAGLKYAGKFRQDVFASQTIEQVLDLAREFYQGQRQEDFDIVMSQDFMMGGHG